MLTDNEKHSAVYGDKVYPNHEHPVWEVTFYSKTEEATATQIRNGAAQFVDVDYIRLLPRGQHMPTTIYDRRVDFEGVTSEPDSLTFRLPDPERFPYEWLRYKEGAAGRSAKGHSLTLAHFLTNADVLFYNSRNITSIEQLAAASGETLRSLGGKSEKHSVQARDWLAKNENLQIVSAITEENKSIKEQNEELARQLEALRLQVSALQDNGDDVVTTRKRKAKDDISG